MDLQQLFGRETLSLAAALSLGLGIGVAAGFLLAKRKIPGGVVNTPVS